MVNADIREKIFKAEITYKEIAAAMGVSREHLSRLLSNKANELTEKSRARIEAAIETVLQERRGA